VPALNDPGQGEQFPQKLKVLIAKMLAKEEEERFQSFKEVSDLLEEILNAHNSNLSARSQGSSPIQSSDHQAQKHKQKHDGEQDQKQNQDPEQEQEQEDDDDNEAEAQGLPFGWPKAFVASIICLILILAGALLYFWPQPTAKVASLSTLQLSKSPPRDSEVARYLTNPNASKLEWRHFLFPKDEPIGTLHWIVNGIRSPKNVSAMGAVNVPPQSQLELTADETLSKQPELFYGFGANDLTAITLKREFSWNDKHIACIGRLTGLRSLTIGDVEFTDKCIDDFNKLNQLEALELDSTNLSDATLAKLKVLRRLRHLSVPGISPISTTLKLLKDSDRINMLGIERCHPTENDLKIVATMSNLNHLFLNNNPGITDKDLAYIGSLRKLDSLSIDGTGVSPGCIKTLKKLPLLDKLSIDSGVLTSADKAQLNEFKVCAVREFPPSEDRGASPFIKPGIEEIGHSNSFFKSAKHQ
jgi:hypothetical protein